VVLHDIDTDHGHDAPPEKPVMLAHAVQLEPPLPFITIRPPSKLVSNNVSSSESVIETIRNLVLILGKASEHQARC